MTEGQRKARGHQRQLTFWTVVWIVLAFWNKGNAAYTAVICGIVMITGVAVIHAMRDLLQRDNGQ